MTTIQKTKIQPTWDNSKVREGAALVAVTNVYSGLTEISKYGPEAIKHYQEAWTTNGKIANLKQQNIKNALELVKHIAEFEANVFGSVVEIWGDEKSASYTYISCGCFDVCRSRGLIKPEMRELFDNFFTGSTEFLARELGFNVEIKKEKEGFPTTTFSTK